MVVFKKQHRSLALLDDLRLEQHAVLWLSLSVLMQSSQVIFLRVELETVTKTICYLALYPLQ